MSCSAPLPWTRPLVYGLGVSGRAAAALLRRRGLPVVGVDRRRREELELGELATDRAVELLLGAELAELPGGVDVVVLSPGVPPERPLLTAARRCGVPVVAEVELAFRCLDGAVVGITGSNGKSTTTALTGAMLAAAGVPHEVCGNIGLPLSACVEGPPGRTFVVELSSFQLEGTEQLHARAAAFLNLSPDHLDRHPLAGDYAAAKARIFRHQTADDVAVLNADDLVTAATAVGGRRRLFSRRGPVDDGCWLDRGTVVEVRPDGEEPLFRADELRLAGVHNLENAMAASLLALAAGAPRLAIRDAVRSFAGLPHRMELIAERRGVRYYNDSKATNPASAERSLEGLADGSVHLVLGGRSKHADLSALVKLAARKARCAYLIGEAAEEMAAALAGVVPTVHAGDLGRAVAAASREAVPGDAVLLAPACASFDQYRDFVARGEHFRALVEALPEAADG